MRRSKLEVCEAVLEALVKEPSTIDGIAYEVNMDCTALERYMDFLLRNGLVEERLLNKKKLYAVTERGVAVFKALNFQKYLEKVAKSIRIMDEASQVIPTISKRISKKEEKNEG
ncbi:MAG: winged helix-turn-helix domain-containing protein [Candidatus Bathycorpusculaceae bacterium]